MQWAECVKRSAGMLSVVFPFGLMVMPMVGQAETETAYLDVTMSAAETVKLDCHTSLSFGVTRIPLKGDSAGQITLSPKTGELTSTGSKDFSLDDAGAQRGVCKLSGSMAPDGTNIEVSFPNGGAEMSGDTVLGLPGGGLSNPEVTLDHSTETTQGGEAEIRIGGTLQLKEGELDNSDYGGYSVTVDVKVVVEE